MVKTLLLPLIRGFCILLAFASCATKSSPWAVHLNPNLEDSSSSRLVHRMDNPLSSLKLEFLQLDKEVKGFCSIEMGSINPKEFGSNKAEVTIHTMGKTYEGFCTIHAGGQRVLLDKATKELILFSLRGHHDVTILIDGYEATFSSENFSQIYKNFLRSTIP